MYSHHSERHFSDRNNWLRASVLGANDGLISTASLLTGVAAAAPDFQTLLLTGVSALIGGAVSMAAGEYVSVSTDSPVVWRIKNNKDSKDTKRVEDVLFFVSKND